MPRWLIRIVLSFNAFVAIFMMPAAYFLEIPVSFSMVWLTIGSAVGLAFSEWED